MGGSTFSLYRTEATEHQGGGLWHNHRACAEEEIMFYLY